MVDADWLLPGGIQWDTGADHLTPTIPLFALFALFHYSTIPLFHYSTIQLFALFPLFALFALFAEWNTAPLPVQPRGSNATECKTSQQSSGGNCCQHLQSTRSLSSNTMSPIFFSHYSSFSFTTWSSALHNWIWSTF